MMRESQKFYPHAMMSDQKKTKNELKYYTEFLNVKALSSMHPEIKKLKTKNSNHAAHGNKNWRSSFVLMDYLTNDPPQSGEKILDIGCGWGLVSIFLSKNFNNEVHSIDIDPSVVPFFSLQTSINKTDTSIKIKNFTEYTKTKISEYGLIVGADICFWDEMTIPLLKFIKQALSSNVRQISIADPGRPPFWDLAEKCAKIGGEVFTRRINEPIKTEKHVLVINKDHK